MTDQENKEQPSPVEIIIKTYLEKGNGNPASAVYLLATEITNQAQTNKVEPSKEIEVALQRLYGQGLKKYSADLGGSLANCIQTGSLVLAVKELYEWSRTPVESRGLLQSSKIQVRQMSRNYIPLMDSPGGRG